MIINYSNVIDTGYATLNLPILLAAGAFIYFVWSCEGLCLIKSVFDHGSISLIICCIIFLILYFFGVYQWYGNNNQTKTISLFTAIIFDLIFVIVIILYVVGYIPIFINRFGKCLLQLCISPRLNEF